MTFKHSNTIPDYNINIMEVTKEIKRVSDSFRALEMLSDTDVSEDYDHDPFY